MSAADTALVVVDVQQRLVPHITGQQRIIWNIGRLIDGARILGLPVLGTEQYPKGLGPTVPELAERLGVLPAKLTFSCAGCPEFCEQLSAGRTHKLLVCGIEAHVCVQQTVLDLLSDGWRVYLPVDAVGSRFEIDYQTALRRMESAGATLTTTEAALFELCRTAGTSQFKAISQLVQQAPPAPG